MQARRIGPVVLAMLLLGASAAAQETEWPKAAPEAGTSESICLLVESAATANGLPLEFFARVIWQESRFRPDAVGPPTRSGDRAEGIAQFMPRTAAERRLLDPFDPVEALPKSAEFLRELHGEFGNLGLAAAAYNAGPRRVHDWLAGRGGLPRETRAYVLAITGRSAEDWAANRDDATPRPTRPLPRPDCRALTALIRTSPNVFVEALEQRIAEGAAAPWGVQLSAGFSRAKVLTAYASLEKRYRTVLVGHDPAIFRLVNRSRGSREFYQIRVGAATRQAADKLCAGLHSAGGACMVLRNPGDRRRATGDR
jgi:hypothetical protein